MESREIKFRGLSVSTESMVYGHYFEQPLRYGHYARIYVEDGDEETEDTGWINVIRETVSQFTGVKINNTGLYEGDVIEWYQKPEGYPLMKDERRTKVIEIKNLISGCFLFSHHKYNIIGNIYEHPELLSTSEANTKRSWYCKKGNSCEEQCMECKFPADSEANTKEK